MTGAAFQDAFSHIHCFGCGVDNPAGLQIKSYWLDPGVVSECRFQPAPYHCAGPAHFVNGGILATLADCHAICTAMAAAYLSENRPLGSEPLIQCATARLDMQYLKPVPIGQVLVVVAKLLSTTGRKMTLSVDVAVGAEVFARATVLAVRVPADWGSPEQGLPPCGPLVP